MPFTNRPETTESMEQLFAKELTLLAIESSCDDTAAAIWSNGAVRSNIVASQVIHKLYGGVVPEVASRAHQQHIMPVVAAALADAGVTKDELQAIAVTTGPGLIGSLLVGVSFAQGLAASLDIPLIAVNHLSGHVLAHFIEEPRPAFPFLNLTVSGGHTQLEIVRDFFEIEIIGRTIDDAAGEAFDKTGKILGLDYPAGPLIDKLAQKGNPVFAFPAPQVADFDFSFSGLKTSILRFLEKEHRANPDFIKENIADICRSVQDRIVSILLEKTVKAALRYGIKTITVSGGVSANSGLRAAFKAEATARDWQLFIPRLAYCTDNAAMIAIVGYLKFQAEEFTPLAQARVFARSV